MKIKKIIVLLLFLLIILCNCCIASECAADLNIEKSINEKNEVIVKISFTGNDNGLLGIQGTLKYDKDMLDIKETTVKKKNWSLTAFNEETGAFLIEITDDAFYDNESYIKSNEEILEVVFQVKEKKNSNIELSDIKVVDSEYKTINLNNISKEVKLKDNKIIYYIAIGGIVILLIIALVIKFKGRIKK